LLVLEIWENPIKSHGYWHFGHGDFIFHNEKKGFVKSEKVMDFLALGVVQTLDRECD
jgi:hypothetical protein